MPMLLYLCAVLFELGVLWFVCEFVAIAAGLVDVLFCPIWLLGTLFRFVVDTLDMFDDC